MIVAGGTVTAVLPLGGLGESASPQAGTIPRQQIRMIAAMPLRPIKRFAYYQEPTLKYRAELPLPPGSTHPSRPNLRETSCYSSGNRPSRNLLDPTCRESHNFATQQKAPAHRAVYFVVHKGVSRCPNPSTSA